MPSPQKKDARRQIDGIILVDKPAGISSFGVVSRIRGRFRPRKAGHGGTLDPLATGLLVILLGKATKQAAGFLQGDKSYRARILLGVETDTQDVTGRVLAEQEPGIFSLERLQEVLEGFRGEIEQIPPMYSALKHRGRPLYELARAGRVVDRPPRRVEIFRLALVGRDGPHLDLEVTCSKGTYVRTLAHDLGQRLGCGACLAELRRTASGSFTLAEATPLEEILESRLEDVLIPLGGSRCA